MVCVSPPELSDATLLIYLDGEADLQTVTHLEQCAYCRQKAQRLAHLQNRLAAQLFRFNCPEPLELGEYHLGLMARDQAAGVAHHLVECPHCRGEVAQLAGYLAKLAPNLEFGPLKRARVWVAQLVDTTRGIGQSPLPPLAPAIAGVRGGEEGPRLYQADDAQIAIEMQEDPEQPDRRMLLGLLTGVEGSGWEAHLWKAAERTAAVPVDELGNFVLSSLAPGNYELILMGPEAEIHFQELEIGTV